MHKIIASCCLAGWLSLCCVSPSAIEQQASFKPYSGTIPETAIRFEMLPIPAGKALIGSPVSEKGRKEDEGPQHTVAIDAFWMGRFEVTWDEFEQFVGAKNVDAVTKPSPAFTDMSFGMGKAGYPAVNITQHAALYYCKWLTEKTGQFYRLPTEAEWEYACRAGTQTPFHFGATITTDLANYRGTDLTAQDTTESGAYGQGPKGSFREQTTDVGYFAVANDFGLFDMHGNAWEWCEDHWHSTYQGAPKDGSAWINSDAAAEDERLLRGGSWNTTPRACRAAIRGKYGANKRDNDLGFRVVCIVD